VPLSSAPCQSRVGHIVVLVAAEEERDRATLAAEGRGLRPLRQPPWRARKSVRCRTALRRRGKGSCGRFSRRAHERTRSPRFSGGGAARVRSSQPVRHERRRRTSAPAADAGRSRPAEIPIHRDRAGPRSSRGGRRGLRCPEPAHFGCRPGAAAADHWLRRGKLPMLTDRRARCPEPPAPHRWPEDRQRCPPVPAAGAQPMRKRLARVQWPRSTGSGQPRAGAVRRRSSQLRIALQ